MVAERTGAPGLARVTDVKPFCAHLGLWHPTLPCGPPEAAGGAWAEQYAQLGAWPWTPQPRVTCSPVSSSPGLI